jgi:hypothetical protein
MYNFIDLCVFVLATISNHLSVYRATPMDRFKVWLQLLLVVLILRQSASVSDHCSELQEDISRLERDLVRLIELKNENEPRAGNCDVSSYIKICSFCKLLVLLSNTYVSVS